MNKGLSEIQSLIFNASREVVMTLRDGKCGMVDENFFQIEKKPRPAVFSIFSKKTKKIDAAIFLKKIDFRIFGK